MDDNNLHDLQITTSPELIKLLGEKLYSNAIPVILVRELLQNSRDATLKRGNIKLSVKASEEEDQFTIDCEDTGCGMDYPTLTDIFLAIGKSGKSKDSNSVGGFGIAKVALFSCDRWEVWTEFHHINDQLKYTETNQRTGTYVAAQIDVSQNKRYSVKRWLREAEMMVRASDVRRLHWNGKKVKRYKGYEELGHGEWGSKYTVSTAKPIEMESGQRISSYIFYRIRGLVQFFESMGYGDANYGLNIIVDFDDLDYRPQDEDYPFSMSRESVNWQIRTDVEEMTKSLEKNVLTTQKKAMEMQAKGKHSNREVFSYNEKTDLLVVSKGKKVRPTLFDRRVARLWKEVGERCVGENGTGYGLIYDPLTRGQHRSHEGRRWLLANPTHVWDIIEMAQINSPMALALRMWHLFVHEYTHKDYADHDEQFTSGESVTANDTADPFSDNWKHIRYRATLVFAAYDKVNGLK